MALGAPSKPTVYNLANQLTASRLLLGIVLFVLIEYHLWILCIVVFALAAITDWADGQVARRLGLVSSLGRMFDPLIDKVVVCGAFIFLLPLPREVTVVGTGVAAWMVVIIVAREFIITGLRGFMEQQGIAFGADWLGKFKMGLQCAALFGIFVVLAVLRWTGDVDLFLVICRDVLIYAAVILTALSGLEYLWKAAAILKQPE
jgi:CDP-diacylglycerol--glycerol-3-phosphate 3-phosphatidyltransferase